MHGQNNIKSIWMFDSCLKFETSTFFTEASSSGKGER